MTLTGNALPTITEALEQLRQGRLRAVDLTRRCLDAIAQHNAALNAFITVTAEEALERAHEADHAQAHGKWLGPLHGIPISLKDLIDQRGVRTTAGSRVLDDTPAAQDAPVTEALRSAGAVLVGKCNLHEFALGTTSDESAYGPVRHPRDPSRSAGGSSGGSAVAVATGMSLASIGTDTGGSIRIPSAACGLVGLKPAAGEVSCDGVVPLSRLLDHVGPLARTVADAALIHAVLTGTDPVTPAAAPPVASLRLAVPRRFIEGRVQDDVERRFDDACRRLRDAGAAIETIDVPELEIAASAYLAIVLPEAAQWHASMLEQRPDRYCPGVRIRLEAGRYMLAEDYVRGLNARRRLRRAIDAALAGRDGLILPALAIAAPPVGATTVRVADRDEPVRAAMLRLTQPFNLTGHPAITLPCGEDSSGVPCGFQLVGPRFNTRALLAAALACERHVARGGTG
ncbi:MAG TPA: amidase [Vicinamibacterales bacterium]|nr:amidase [Vicinamibacterales bacterium]